MFPSEVLNLVELVLNYAKYCGTLKLNYLVVPKDQTQRNPPLPRIPALPGRDGSISFERRGGIPSWARQRGVSYWNRPKPRRALPPLSPSERAECKEDRPPVIIAAASAPVVSRTVPVPLPGTRSPRPTDPPSCRGSGSGARPRPDIAPGVGRCPQPRGRASWTRRRLLPHHGTKHLPRIHDAPFPSLEETAGEGPCPPNPHGEIRPPSRSPATYPASMRSPGASSTTGPEGAEAKGNSRSGRAGGRERAPTLPRGRPADGVRVHFSFRGQWGRHPPLRRRRRRPSTARRRPTL